MWWHRRTSQADDTDEAQKIRAETEQTMRQLKAQGPYVSWLSARLVERRELNHFGDDIQITFTPRGNHA